MPRPLQVMVRVCIMYYFSQTTFQLHAAPKTDLKQTNAPSVAVHENPVWHPNLSYLLPKYMLRVVVVLQAGWRASDCLTGNGAGSPKPMLRKSQVAVHVSATSEKISASNVSRRNWRGKINLLHCILECVEGASQWLSCIFSFRIIALALDGCGAHM